MSKKIATESIDETPYMEESIENLVERYLNDYARFVNIGGRTIPYFKDTLKTPQRRILLSAFNATKNGQYVKSARIVGDCMSTYHPHGDASLYETLTNLVRDGFLEGRGNFGSNCGVEPIEAAAMRYCVTGDTLIETIKGLAPISELVSPSHRKEKEVNINEFILNKNNAYVHASKWFNCGKHETVKITTRLGYTIECTLNHPLFGRKNIHNGELFNNYDDWILAQNLCIGDELYIVCNTYTPNLDYNDVGIIDLVIDQLNNKKENWRCIPLIATRSFSKKLMRKFFLKYINQFDFKRCDQIDIDAILAEPELKKHLKESKMRAYIFTDKTFVKELQTLLLSIGIISIVLYGSDYSVLIINESDSQENKKLEYNPPMRFRDMIETIELVGKQNVYSIRVDDETHSFIGNGFMNHNTEARLSPLIKEIAFKYIDFVPYFKNDLNTNEPEYLPSMLPLNLVQFSTNAELTTGIGFGLKYTQPMFDFKSSIDFMKKIIDNAQVTEKDIKLKYKKYITKISSNLFYKGTDRLPIDGIYSIENNGKVVIVTQFPPDRKPETMLKHFASYIDGSKEETHIIVNLERGKYAADYDLKNIFSSVINFDLLFHDNTMIRRYGVAEIFYAVYENFKAAVLNSLQYEESEFLDKMNLYDYLILIKPYLNPLNSKAANRIQKNTNLEESVIKKLLNYSIDTICRADELKKETMKNLKTVRSKIKSIDNYCYKMYEGMK